MNNTKKIKTNNQLKEITESGLTFPEFVSHKMGFIKTGDVKIYIRLIVLVKEK